MKRTSIIVRHVGEIYHNANAGKGHSWTILNGALRGCLNNCITAHMPFEENDFKNLMSLYRGHYWFGKDADGRGCGGGFYAQAVLSGNISACLSFESWKQFKPFLFLGQRMAVGSEICWPKHTPEELALAASPKNDLAVVNLLSRAGHRWFVTGMCSAKIRVSSYYRKGARGKWGHREGSPTHLGSFTLSDLDTMNRAIRKAIAGFKTKKVPTGWVTRDVAIKAGNCPHGTDAFIQGRVVPHLEASGCSVGSLDGAAIRAKELLKIENSRYTRRATRGTNENPC